MPMAVLRKREVKWLEMLENWEKFMSKRFRKVCSGCCTIQQYLYTVTLPSCLWNICCCYNAASVWASNVAHPQKV